MHNSFYRAILHNSLITNQKTILGCAPFIFLPIEETTERVIECVDSLLKRYGVVVEGVLVLV